MSLVTDEIRAAASETYEGDDICQEKSRLLLTEMNLPNGLLPLKDMEECGYVKETGFVWLRQKAKCEHRFEKIGRPVRYATEVTAYVEPNRIRKLTGVKTKELLLWVTLSDIYVDDPPTGKITFKTPAGLSRSFPVEAFQIEEPKVVEEKENEKEKEKEKEEAGDGGLPAPEEKEEVKANLLPEKEVKVDAPAAAAAAVEVKEV
ncbi:Protein of unknown function- DUF538 [Striga hermonthica]|uniref:Uncharacterized protein n=1 Tax=Striga hermonthica TaxID=68872 RepID=A0A9N7R9Z7_STRHE|nr:Protein of unknown function- DUF538 [Striga hermonthica]